MQKIILLLPFLAVLQLNAQIHYTDLKPNYVQNTTGVKNLDLNGDLKTDLQFSLTILDPSSDVWFVLSTDDSVDVFIDSTQFNSVGRINSNKLIHSGLKWKTGSNIPVAYLTSGAAEGPWPGSVSKYMAFRIRNGANHYYGWLRMSVHSKVNSFTLQEFAYETTPNKTITTDDLLTAAPTVASKVEYLSYTLDGRTLYFSETLRFELFDLSGRSVLSNYPDQFSKTVALNELPSGVYLIKLEGSQGLVSKKLYLR